MATAVREPRRCAWPLGNPQMMAYHDQEWGVPVHDDGRLFEGLALGGAQAGLNWAIVLKKREAYRAAFADFDPAHVARFTKRDVTRLLKNEGLIRNRQKIEAAIANARQVLTVQDTLGSLDHYLWGFVDGRPIRNRWRSVAELPARTELSDRISADLKKRGFKFAGSTIVYAFMQAVGLVNDHVVSCFRYREIGNKTR
jgi:DNA-3-methyladenine glycosylase I